jgi:hypothetical protein
MFRTDARDGLTREVRTSYEYEGSGFMPNQDLSS